MMGFDWKQTVGAVAPVLGAALGGPLGGLAGSALASVLGVGNTEAELETAVKNATPEQIVQIRALDNTFKVQMAELGYKSVADLEAIASGDRANARAREIAVRDWMPKALGLIVVFGFLGALALLIFVELPPTGRDSVLLLIGTLAGEFGSVIRYYYGSSSGSAAKSRTIDSITGVSK